MFDGGCREACIMRWPGKIPAGSVCHEVAATIDVLPTIAGLVDVELPKDRIIDGKDIWPLMSGEPGAKSPHEAYYFYWGGHLQAVRSGKWKLHFPHGYRSLDGRPGGTASPAAGGTASPAAGGTGGKPVAYTQKKIGLALFDLDSDIGETTNVAEKHPEVVARLQALAEKARDDLGDLATKRKGKNVRQPGRLEKGEPVLGN
jgi:arylsulfatase A